MSQVKKTSVNTAILDAAFILYSEKGYQGTSMLDIAGKAGITVGNIYRYYNSKFDVLYGVIEPWLIEQLDQAEERVVQIDNNPDKFREILTFLWIDLPRADNNFEKNLMEALATKKPDVPYSRRLLKVSEYRIARMLDDTLPEKARQRFPSDSLAHLMFMCHDGFVLNVGLVDENERNEHLINQLVSLVFGPDSQEASV